MDAIWVFVEESEVELKVVSDEVELKVVSGEGELKIVLGIIGVFEAVVGVVSVEVELKVVSCEGELKIVSGIIGAFEAVVGIVVDVEVVVGVVVVDVVEVVVDVVEAVVVFFFRSFLETLFEVEDVEGTEKDSFWAVIVNFWRFEETDDGVVDVSVPFPVWIDWSSFAVKRLISSVFGFVTAWVGILIVMFVDDWKSFSSGITLILKFKVEDSEICFEVSFFVVIVIIIVCSAEGEFVVNIICIVEGSIDVNVVDCWIEEGFVVVIDAGCFIGFVCFVDVDERAVKIVLVAVGWIVRIEVLVVVVNGAVGTG